MKKAHWQFYLRLFCENIKNKLILNDQNYFCKNFGGWAMNKVWAKIGQGNELKLCKKGEPVQKDGKFIQRNNL